METEQIIFDAGLHDVHERCVDGPDAVNGPPIREYAARYGGQYGPALLQPIGITRYLADADWHRAQCLLDLVGQRR